MMRLPALSAICLLALSACSSRAPIERVGLCVQYEGPGPRISAAVVAAPSTNPQWDSDISKDIVGLQVPAPFAYSAGTWIPITIEREPRAERLDGAADFNCDHLNRPAT